MTLLARTSLADAPSERAGPIRDPAAEAAEWLTAVLRLAVAVASAAIYRVDPSEDPGRRPHAYAVLAAYALYAALVAGATRRGGRRPSRSAAPWIDIAFVTLLVAVSEGTSSIFFPLYLFPVLSAAFEGGARAALPAVGVSVAAFSVVGGLTGPRGPDFELDRALIRPMYLGVLGYLIGFWGEHERRSRRKLQLLRDTTALSNPRFGAARSLAAVLEAVRAFFDADSCRLVAAGPDGDGWTRVARRGQAVDPEPVALPGELARALLPAPPGATFLHARRRRGVALRRRPEPEVLLAPDGGWARAEPAQAERIAALLDAEGFVSVPFRAGPELAGRVYLTSARPRAFQRDDAAFLEHVLAQVAPVLQNLRVVDRLASEAAGAERRRIARDLHDSLIQPYVGLRLGLASLRQAVGAGRADDARRDLDRLLEMADAEIDALRGFTRDLADTARGASGVALAPALERCCVRFAEATGIRVGLHLSLEQLVADRLAAEVLQLVAEALSNVRRHTAATEAEVRVGVDGGAVRIEVENDRAPDGGAPAFSPVSLTERAAALGGRAVVASARGRTAVHIQIPL